MYYSAPRNSVQSGLRFTFTPWFLGTSYAICQSGRLCQKARSSAFPHANILQKAYGKEPESEAAQSIPDCGRSLAAMNVLVYNGPGVSATSLSQILSSTRALLHPHYAVQTVTASALASQPWGSSCALLVVPGGRDLPYVSSLASATQAIKSYVENGGAFLGICAGAYYASRRIEWESGTKLEVTGNRPLGFFDGVCKGSVYPGFAYEDESGARAVSVEDVDAAEIVHGLYHNGGGEFIGVESSSTADVFAKYVDGEGEGKIAAVRCRVGKGNAILWGAHPEYSLAQEPLLSALKKRNPPLSEDEMRAGERGRLQLLRKTLTMLGLRLPDEAQDSNKSITSPLPQFLTSSIPSLPIHVLNLLAENATSTEPKLLQESNDTFRLHEASSASTVMREARGRPEDPENLKLPKDIIFYARGELPPPELTPKFSIQQYYSHLSSIRTSHGVKSLDDAGEWGFGELFFYSEAVTSTQTMLDKNPNLLRTLPAPLLSLATHQLSGRGRGSNAWLSPAGCLQFSLLLRPTLSSLPAARLVFVQYLFGLAVVEACRELLGQNGECVRLKWPNDVYAILSMTGEDGRVKEEKKKLGGILVTTNFNGGKMDVIIGCGLNVMNPFPTTSLSQLTKTELTIEKTVATIMVISEQMWKRFVDAHGTFDPFIDLYLERWLHSDQLVTLTTISPPVSVRILGITLDHGLLRTLPERGNSNDGGNYIDVQADGNSFDMMAGLIRRKN